MKKLFGALFVGAVALAIPALANVETLNSAVKNLLADFNNAVTVAELKFDDVKVDNQRALSVKASGIFRKIGATNALEVKVDEVSYEYGDGTAPTTKISGSISLDLLKLISQQDINGMAPSVEDMVKGFAQNFTQDYGNAVAVDAKVSDKQMNEKGDLESISIHLGMKLDLAKLPAEKPANEEMIRELSVDFKIGVKGAAINVTAVSNPDYKGFQEDQTGLKEVLEKLLNVDAETLQEIKTNFSGLDRVATELVNYKPQE